MCGTTGLLWSQPSPGQMQSRALAGRHPWACTVLPLSLSSLICEMGLRTGAFAPRLAQEIANQIAAVVAIVLVIIIINPKGGSILQGSESRTWIGECFSQASPANQAPPGAILGPMYLKSCCPWSAGCPAPAKTLSCLAQKEQAINFWKVFKPQGHPSGGSGRLAEVGFSEDPPPHPTQLSKLMVQGVAAAGLQGFASPLLLPQVTASRPSTQIKVLSVTSSRLFTWHPNPKGRKEGSP